MRNLLPMATAPRDGTKFIGAWRETRGGVYYATCSREEDHDEWVDTRGDRVIEPKAWHPLPGSPPLPMSTAPKDGRRIQVKVFRGDRLTATWEHVEWKEVGSGDYRKLEWYGEWMAFVTNAERDESGWLGWWPCPGED